jgi:hypothetical protein
MTKQEFADIMVEALVEWTDKFTAHPYPLDPYKPPYEKWFINFKFFVDNFFDHEKDDNPWTTTHGGNNSGSIANTIPPTKKIPRF